MEKANMIHRITCKSIPLVRLFLTIKAGASSSFFFYLLLFCFKILGILIVSTNFTTDWSIQYSFKISQILRSLTVFGWFGSNFSFSIYSALCYFLCGFLLICFWILYSFYSQIKIKEKFLMTSRGINMSMTVSFLFHSLLVINQHLLELFSFIYVIIFNIGDSNSYAGSYTLFNHFNLNPEEKFKGWILIITNTFSILFLNVFNYYAFYIINEPFFDTKFPLQLRYYSKFHVFIYMMISNLQCLHYIELLLPTTGVLIIYKYVLFSIKNASIVVNFVRSYSSFNYYNFFSILTNFVFTFCLFSSVLDLILYQTSNLVSDLKSLLFILVSKLILCSCWVILNIMISEKLFVNLCKTSLFKLYDGKISGRDQDSLFFTINLLIDLRKQKIEDLSKLMSIILNHKAECGLDYCKCNIIVNYKPAHLSYDVNFILEGIFTNLNLGKDQVTNLLFSEYLYYMKKSTLFSYAVLNTFISKNMNTVSSLDLLNFYVIMLKKVEEYDLKLVTHSEYVNFLTIYEHIDLLNFYHDKMTNYLENFEKLLNFKEKFDNSLKVSHSDSKIDSYIFETSLNSLVDACKKNKSLYKKMIGHVQQHFQHEKCKSIELSFKLYTFFIIFNRKIPNKISSLIFLDSALEYEAHSSIQKYFNFMFLKYFGDKRSPQSIIIEINKMFKIKYFSYKLSQLLGLNYNKLIGDDIHTVFPECLREPHKKLLLNNFLIKSQSYFFKKSFAFTAGNNIVPMYLKVTCMPKLDKSLQAVVSCNLIEENPEEKKTFYFILSEYYELIALSENLETDFSINFELIEKLNISIEKMFDIVDMIPKKFKSNLDKIFKYKQKKQIESLYSLSHFFFNLNQEEEINYANNNVNNNINTGIIGNSQSLLSSLKDLKSKKGKQGQVLNSLDRSSNPTGNTKVGDPSLGINTPHSANTLSKNTYDNFVEISSMTKSNFIKKSLSKIAKKNVNTKIKPGPDSANQNFDTSNFQGDLSELKDQLDDTGSVIYENDSFSLVRDKKVVIFYLEKLKNKCQDMEVGEIYYNKLCEAIRLMKGNEDETTEDGNNKINGYFNVTINFRKINDAPFYIVSFKEKKINLSGRKMSHMGSPGEVKRPVKSVNFRIAKHGWSPQTRARNDEETTGFSHNLMNPAFLKRRKPYQNKSNNKKNHYFGEELARSKKEEKTIRSAKRFELIITIILGFLHLIHICISSSVFYLKVYSISTTESLFMVKHSNKIQEASYLSLYSSIISYVMLLGNYTTYESNFIRKAKTINLNPNYFKPLIFFRASILRQDFSYFFDYVQTTSYPLDNVNKILYSSDSQFSKTLITWDNIVFNTTFTEVIEYISSNSMKLSLDNNTDSLVQDIENAFLFKKYKNLKGVNQKSTVSNIIYYLNQNTAIIDTLIKNIESNIDIAMTDFKNTFRQATFLVEIISILFSVILIFFIYYVLIQYDQSLFRVILCMFLNLRKDKSSEYKTPNETGLLKYRVKSFKAMIESFTQLNIKEIEEVINIEDASNLMNYRESKNTGLTTRNTTIVPKESTNMMTAKIATINSEKGNFNTNYSPVNNSTNSILPHGNNSTVSPMTLNSALGMNPVNGLSAGNKLDLIAMAIGGHKIQPEESEKPKKKNTKNHRKEKELTLENDSMITNGHILKSTKHHSINFLKVAKLIIVIIFLIYILFIVCNMIVTNLYFKDIDSDIALISNLVLKFPALTHIYNKLRVAILSNDGDYMRNFSDYIDQFNTADSYYDTLMNNFQTKMPQLYNFVAVADSQNYTQRSVLLCKDISSDSCNLILDMLNPFNKEGLRLSMKTILQTAINIDKDYSRLINKKDDISILLQYFTTEEFADVNLDVDLIFQDYNDRMLDTMKTDMSLLFLSTYNLFILLGLLSIILNLIITAYLICAFFNGIKNSIKFIDYSAKKFNRALFDSIQFNN